MREMTDNHGADVVFECAGVEASASQCLEVVRKGGCFTQIGLFGRQISIDFDKMVLKELHLQGVFSSNWRSWYRALRLVRQGHVQLKPLITHRLPLSEWRQAFELLWRHEGMKVLLLPEE